MEYSRITELRGVHGVTLEEALPKVSSYEGMQEVLLPSTVAFEFNKEMQTLKLKPEGASAVQDYNVKYEGYKKAMRLASFSESVISSYPVELMIEPLNYAFRNKLGAELKAFVQDGSLVAFVKPSLELVSAASLVRKMHEVLAQSADNAGKANANSDNVLFERIHHDLQYTSCSALIPFRSREWVDERLDGGHNFLKGKDVICGGVTFKASLMGETATEVNGYIYRLICSNGLISAESRFKWSRKTESTPMLDWFGDRVKACVEGLEHEFEKIDNLQKIPVPEHHRGEILANVFQQYELSEHMRRGVLARLVDNPPRNMWDIVNAITNLAEDAEYQDNPHTIRRLQEIGGDMSSKLHVCPTCHAVGR